MTEATIARLRQTQCCDPIIDSVISDALDTITRLRTELDAARQEIERVRAALFRLAEWSDPFVNAKTPISAETLWREFPAALKNARAALEPRAARVCDACGNSGVVIESAHPVEIAIACPLCEAARAEKEGGE